MPRGFCVILALSVPLAVTLLGGGCDLDSLRSSALYPRPDAATDGAGMDDGAAPGTDAQTDRHVDVPLDLPAVTGMLSGTVRESCGNGGTDALIGIGGRHTCSFPDKGAYFLAQLPVGTLKLTASKAGYALYEATIVITAGGNIHDIQLGPADAGGCPTLPMPPVACTCTSSACEP